MSRALIIGGGILAFLLLSYLCATMHGPALTATTPLAPPSLWASMADGKVTLTGTLPNEAAKGNVLAEASKIYGDGNVIDELKISNTVGEAAWMPAGLGMFGLMKDGVKKAGFGFENGNLTLNGIVKNIDAESKLLADARAAFPNTDVIDKVDVEAAAVQRNIGEFLSTRTIEFATGSAVILPRGKAILDTVAMMLAEAPDAMIEVSGHTDNIGKEATNTLLSQRRADATEAYLIKKGIVDARMTSKGYGQTMPIADNATPDGRQRNRRIQFGLR
jgi:OOP family OmpA-OmpF porin